MDPIKRNDASYWKQKYEKEKGKELKEKKETSTIEYGGACEENPMWVPDVSAWAHESGCFCYDLVSETKLENIGYPVGALIGGTMSLAVWGVYAGTWLSIKIISKSAELIADKL